MQNKNTVSKTWAPESFGEIRGKASLYKTARIIASSECVSIVGYSDGTFTVEGQFGREDYSWRELDSFCL